jgi:type I restriction enzyme, S subunit
MSNESKVENYKYQDSGFVNLPRNWKLLTVDDIKSLKKKAIISGPFGSNISSKYFVDKGIPIIRGNNLSLNIGIKFVDNGFAYLTKEKAEELNTWAVKDDLIFTAVGTIGQVGILKGSEMYEKYIISNKQLRLTVNREIIEPLFAYYWFASDIVVEQIRQRNTGSSVPLINLSVLKSLIVPLPPLPEQKAIAAVLSSLDDKIDLLHRQNATLEAMAETLFKQWFVVEASDEWEEKNLLELIELVGGGTPKTSVAEYWDGNIPWLSGGDAANSNKNFIYHTQKTISDSGLKNSSAKKLPQFSTVISARGTVGKYCILSREMAFSQSNYGVLPKIAKCPFFTYLLVGYSVNELQSSAYGSVFDTITTTTFEGIVLSMPDKTKILEFENHIAPLFYKKLKNQHQIQTLEKLRDTLLSKLMSGEVRVRYE